MIIFKKFFFTNIAFLYTLPDKNIIYITRGEPVNLLKIIC